MDEKLIRLIFGKRGCGKTKLAQSLIAPQPRVIVYDTLGEYTDGVLIDQQETLGLFWLKVYRHQFRIVYQPLDPEGEFDWCCRLVWECGHVTFLVEELDRYAKPLGMSLALKEIVQRGRHREIELIGVTQRAANIDRLITSQAKEMFIFNTTEPRDIDYFKDTIGSDVTELLADLKEFEFVRWRDNVDELAIEKAKEWQP